LTGRGLLNEADAANIATFVASCCVQMIDVVALRASGLFRLTSWFKRRQIF
jgi:hypothetical protein